MLCGPKEQFIKLWAIILYELTELNMENDKEIGNSKTFLKMQEPSINSKPTMLQIPGALGGAHPQ